MNHLVYALYLLLVVEVQRANLVAIVLVLGHEMKLVVGE
jgi:hypothetical protein